jgi:hypothetical protein
MPMGKVKLRLSPTVARGPALCRNQADRRQSLRRKPLSCLLSLKLDCYATILSAQA